MTAEEFNQKYNDFLISGHYGLSINNSKVIEYLDKKFQEFIKIPGFKYYQIKMKFNWVSFYCEGLNRQEISLLEEKLVRLLNEN